MSLQPLYQPPAAVQKGAWVNSMDSYKALYEKSLKDPDAFWGEMAESFHWNKKWDGPVSNYNLDLNKGNVFIEWFKGAQTNVCYNALDRHVAAGRGDDVCIYWEGNDIEHSAKVTFKQMLDTVSQVANYLKSQGVGKGDDVTIYMPMIPELPAVMLACARIGAVHSVVFAGFSAESLAGRIMDSSPKIVVTCSAVRRGAKPIELKKIVDEALEICDSEEEFHVPHVLVYDHVLSGVSREHIHKSYVEGRDVYWQASAGGAAVEGDSGEPGLAGQAGQAGQAGRGGEAGRVRRWRRDGSLDARARREARTVQSAGSSPLAPPRPPPCQQDVIPQQSKDCPVEWMEAEDPLFKLYTSGSTGKPKGVLHTTAGYMMGSSLTFKYVFDYHPGDVYWCTADCGWITGHSYVTYGPMIAGAPQVVFEGVPTYPDAGRCWEVCDKYNVTLFYTAPTAIRTLMACGEDFVKKHGRKSLRILGTVGEPINPEAWRWYYEVVGDSRCAIVDTWWQTETGAHMITPLPGATPMKPGSATFPFFGVEVAILDDKGNELQGACQGIMGRVDDVINVSGHRIGTAEVESALVAFPECAEAAVVPVDHPIKGQAIYAFVTLMGGHSYPATDDIRKGLVAQVRKVIGPIATPDVIHWAPGLPKTRSGKIMRRILRKIASNEEDQLGDISTLADPSVVQQLLDLRGK
eukprot:scaffold3.g6499.t1